MSLMPVINEIKFQGVISLNGIAVELNARGVKTTHGRRWSALHVFRPKQRLLKKTC